MPLRQRQVTGLVVECPETTELEVDALKEVVEVLDTEPLLPAHLLELADFIASYYRCPLGDTLASMLPAALLRSDAETAEITPTGAATPAEALSDLQGRLLAELQSARKLRVASLLSRIGTSRSPLDALVKAGLVRVRRRRRDRGPQVEVGAVAGVVFQRVLGVLAPALVSVPLEGDEGDGALGDMSGQCRGHVGLRHSTSPARAASISSAICRRVLSTAFMSYS